METFFRGIWSAIIRSRRDPLIGLASALIVVFACYWFISTSWKEHRLSLDGTVETGIFMQSVGDAATERLGRPPTCAELQKILEHLCSFREGVSPFKSNRIVPKFDNHGGWCYAQDSGILMINYSNTTAIGYKTYIDISSIRFRYPSSVTVVRRGVPHSIDYSYYRAYVGSLSEYVQSAIKSVLALPLSKTDPLPLG
jgi:hypothetical protein